MSCDRNQDKSIKPISGYWKSECAFCITAFYVEEMHFYVIHAASTQFFLRWIVNWIILQMQYYYCTTMLQRQQPLHWRRTPPMMRLNHRPQRCPATLNIIRAIRIQPIMNLIVRWKRFLYLYGGHKRCRYQLFYQ